MSIWKRTTVGYGAWNCMIHPQRDILEKCQTGKAMMHLIAIGTAKRSQKWIYFNEQEFWIETIMQLACPFVSNKGSLFIIQNCSLMLWFSQKSKKNSGLWSVGLLDIFATIDMLDHSLFETDFNFYEWFQ